ncbi:hypothetical protein [Teredinibacter purpureus]|uniref:hypothetical protein n=1 Tax=Teredinibacter purpureus TaxID=2731756 RepID=UPI0005F7E56C|nr:hypothetical protein [Teredinibacter purpureus]
MNKLIALIILFPLNILANPFLELIPGDSCSEAKAIESLIVGAEKGQVELDDEVVFYSVSGEHKGYRVQISYQCRATELINFSYKEFAEYSEAKEVVYSWVPIIKTKIGEPYIHTKFLNKEELPNPDTVMVAWNYKNILCTAAVDSIDYGAVWSW